MCRTTLGAQNMPEDQRRSVWRVPRLVPQRRLGHAWVSLSARLCPPLVPTPDVEHEDTV